MAIPVTGLFVFFCVKTACGWFHLPAERSFCLQKMLGNDITWKCVIYNSRLAGKLFTALTKQFIWLWPFRPIVSDCFTCLGKQVSHVIQKSSHDFSPCKLLICLSPFGNGCNYNCKLVLFASQTSQLWHHRIDKCA